MSLTFEKGMEPVQEEIDARWNCRGEREDNMNNPCTDIYILYRCAKSQFISEGKKEG